MTAALPPNCAVKSGRYYFIKRQNGRRVWVKLTKVDDGLSHFYRALAREVADLNAGTVNGLIDQYLESARFRELADTTQKDYSGYIGRTLRPVFGEMPVDAVDRDHVAGYLEARRDDGRAAIANKEVSCLSAIFNFAVRKKLAKSNPCYGVPRNPVKPRSRYVTADEFEQSLAATTPEFADLMRAAYLTGFRQQDLRLLRKTDCTAEGIFLEPRKTRNRPRSQRIIMEWSPALRELVDRASARAPGSEFVFSNTKGELWKVWAIQSARARLKKKTGLDFTYHDLRAAAESDHETGLGLLPLYKRVKRLTPVA